jgi:oxygen-independent coproporphyrinogen-3 oxidase
MNTEKIPGLYIHIPFCVSKCPYCDFYSSTSLSAIPDFLNGLFKEMERYRHWFGSFDTIYIGGGTPSLLTPKQLEGILIEIRKNFHLTSTPEITMEANPADLNLHFLRSILRSILEIGIHRINIGVQSFDERVLGFLGRRHSANQARSAIEASREAGFDNIGLDLIYAVPGQEMDSWFDTLREALLFSPEHLSCYQLTLESETPLGKRFRAGEFPAPGEGLQYEFFMKTSETLEGAGYTHYEVSNFARGFKYASRHNQKYWDHSPYLGLGPSAYSFDGTQRWWNHRSIDRYLDAINRGNFPVEGKETLTTENLKLEALYFGLRTKKGINLDDFKNQYACNLWCEKKEIWIRLQEEGFLSLHNGRLSPTPKGFAIADSLALL